MRENVISIYTDGSCNPKHQAGGWAAILLIDDRKVVLKGFVTETSHHRMEIIAVLKALDYLREIKLQKKPVSIFVDSQYVAELGDRKQRLTTHNFKTKKGTSIRNADLVQLLLKYMDEFENLNFIKIPSHGKREEGSEGPNYNREVDILSRKEVRKRDI